MSELFQFYFPAPDPPAAIPAPEPHTLEQYRLRALQLLTRGTAFALQVGTAVSDFMEGCVAEFARIDAEISRLRAAALPLDAVDPYLSDWEDVLELPHTGTLAERQQRAMAKLLGAERNHLAAVTAAIEAAGLALVEVRRVNLFEVDHAAIGDPLYSDEWAFVTWFVVSGTADPVVLAAMQAEIRARFGRAHTLIYVIAE